MGQAVVGVGYRDARADELRARYHACYGDRDLPVPVEAIAVDVLGLSVDELPLEVSGLLLPAERQIYVNAAESPQRRRFTLAHELGHWICQCAEGRGAPIYCRAADVAADADRVLEREANVFAAELLMPQAAVRSAWDELKAVDAVASRFVVSLSAMQWRLYSYDLAPQPTRVT